MSSEAADRADFSLIRYGQCWEDADVLLSALNIQPGDTCLSIASAGDNALAMLTQNPDRVIAIDLSFAQIACLELRVAAYRELNHRQLLMLLGSRPCPNRERLYQRCRSQLSSPVRQFWDRQLPQVQGGIGGAGKFERYFAGFRQTILPLTQAPGSVDRLLKGGTLEQRQAFYNEVWNNWRWRLLFRVFFSRFVMGRAGRDPSFFKYVEGSVADRIFQRTEHALTQLDPAENPYLQWILTGTHTTALPYALRPEHFDRIRDNLDRLEWHVGALEDWLDRLGPRTIDRFNLSDVFEYLSPDNSAQLLSRLADCGRTQGRLVYWNMLTPRSRPESLADRLQPLRSLAAELHQQDKAFFYSALVIEEIQ